MMLFISSVVSAVFGMDMSELGLKSDDSSSMFGDRVEGRISSSKARGLSSLLMYIRQHMNKVLYRITNQYKLRFVGFDTEEEILRTDLMEKRLRAGWTIDEIRTEDGREPMNNEYSGHVLNPVGIQMLISNKDRDLQEDIQDDNIKLAQKQLEVDKVKAKSSSGGSK